jgi:uncharacterized protein (DUF4415 family)
MTTNSPRERGRPPIPKDEQKAKINITIDKELLALIEQHGTNRSKYINQLLRKALTRPA